MTGGYLNGVLTLGPGVPREKHSIHPDGEKETGGQRYLPLVRRGTGKADGVHPARVLSPAAQGLARDDIPQDHELVGTTGTQLAVVAGGLG